MPPAGRLPTPLLPIKRSNRASRLPHGKINKEVGRAIPSASIDLLTTTTSKDATGTKKFDLGLAGIKRRTALSYHELEGSLAPPLASDGLAISTANVDDVIAIRLKGGGNSIVGRR
ncbi:unnamed protein product [Linum trigynum]|uniref:Uncharacterized protein n=1 Tax=Linum trigynum TaxID=586398 RepID=A0AAV2GLV0_9ROSI